MAVRQVSKSTIAQGIPKGSKAWDQLSSTAFAAELLIVGGGGGGSGDGCYSGGGGSGQTRDLSITINLAQTYPITIGAGAFAAVGGSSTAFGYTAIGGNSSPQYTGGTSGNGHGGGSAAICPACCASGGGGGGATGGGSGAAGCSTHGIGGPGFNWKSLGTTYASGGRGMNNCSGAGNGAANTGNGAAGNATGGSGIVIVRYTGAQKGTGGTITSSGGYTYHTFTANGNLVT
jgi:hypothetical protein